MLGFISRRLGVSVFIVFASTILSFMLVVISGDPLEDLRQLSDAKAAAAKIAARTEIMHLDKSPIERYFMWLGEVGRCIVSPVSGGQCTLGQDRAGRDVMPQLTNAMGQTIRLVLAATIIALFLGIITGIVTALRQYSTFDYAITFVAFLCFSMPSFWIATLLKQYVAIDFNTWLGNPAIPIGVLIGISVVGGLLWMLIIGGDTRRRLMVLGIGAVGTGLPLWLLLTFNFFKGPRLGLIGIILSAVALAFIWTTLMAGLRKRKAQVLFSTLVTALVGIAVYCLLNFVVGQVWDKANEWMLIGFAVLAVGVGMLIGWLMGGYNRGAAMKASALTAVSIGVFIAIDRLLMAYPQEFKVTNGHPIYTTGSQTPNLPNDFWFVSLDRVTHLILPTMAIALISFATYTRYTRASTLDTMNQDFVRTARSKGLAERTVVVRHVFRNAMIPISTLVALDFAGVMSGAVITENVFGWTGMGKFFQTSLTNVDPNPLMAFMLVTATLIVVMNLVADIAYAFLDPRIRLK